MITITQVQPPSGVPAPESRTPGGLVIPDAVKTAYERAGSPIDALDASEYGALVEALRKDLQLNGNTDLLPGSVGPTALGRSGVGSNALGPRPLGVAQLSANVNVAANTQPYISPATAGANWTIVYNQHSQTPTVPAFTVSSAANQFNGLIVPIAGLYRCRLFARVDQSAGGGGGGANWTETAVYANGVLQRVWTTNDGYSTLYMEDVFNMPVGANWGVGFQTGPGTTGLWYGTSNSGIALTITCEYVNTGIS